MAFAKSAVPASRSSIYSMFDLLLLLSEGHLLYFGPARGAVRGPCHPRSHSHLDTCNATRAAVGQPEPAWQI